MRYAWFAVGWAWVVPMLAACTQSTMQASRRHYTAGVEDSRGGRPTQAIAEYREAIRLDPGSPEAHNELGRALYQIGERDAAIEEYRRAVQLKPDFAEAHNNLGVALLSAGQIVFAVSEYRQAVTLRPDLAEAQYNLCLGLELLGHLHEALSHCQLAARQAPQLGGLADSIMRLQSKLAGR